MTSPDILVLAAAMPLTELAKAIADARGSSVLILEMTLSDGVLFCEDASRLREHGNRKIVLTGMLTALQALVGHTMEALREVELADEMAALDAFKASARANGMGEL